MKIKFLQKLRASLLLFFVVFIGLNASGQVIATIGTGTGTSGGAYGNSSPISNYYKSSHHQILYTKAAIDAAIMASGGTINVAKLIDSLAWDVVSPGTYALPSYTIKMKNTTATSTAVYDGAGFTQVYTTSSYSPVANSFTSFLPFQTSFFWDGVSNILIDVCWDVSSNWSSLGTVRYTTAANADNFMESDASNQCSIVTNNLNDNRANVKMSLRNAPVCTNPVNAGNAVAVDSICPNVSFSIGANGATAGAAGLTYQWQSSPNGGAGPWTDIAGATTMSYTVTAGITANTYYRLKVACSGGTAAYSSEKFVAVKSWITCYCTPTYTSGCTSGGTINSFSTTGALVNVSNLNTGCASGGTGYSNYLNMSISAAATFAFNFSVNITSYNSGVKIWADWNHDGVFDPVTELCAASTATIIAGSNFTGTITPPATALSGPTRLRVRCVEGSTTFDPCSSHSYGETEDYTINVVVPPACNTLTTPSNVHAIAFPSNLCVSGNVNLSIDSIMPTSSGITYQWQSSPNGTTWTNIVGATNPTASVTGVNATTYYKLLINCNGNLWTTAAMDTVIVTNPGTIIGTPGQRCGPGQVALAAAPSIAGTPINWYTTATGGMPIGTGPAFTTPYIPTTTNFYAAAASGSSPAQAWVGTGTASISTPSPYYNFYWGSKNQFLIRASELIAAGLGPGVIQSIAFDVIGANTLALSNFEIKMKQTSLTALTTWETGLTSVYTNASYLPTAGGVNVHTLSTPFIWDGVSNIVIESCFNNSSWQSGNSVRGTTGLSYNASLYYNSDVSTVCTSPGSGTVTTSRPNIRFNMMLGCESPRVPVLATINAGPAITKSSPPVVCNNAVATVSVTLPAGTYVPYKFYPVTDLYTDAAATIPYTGGNATTVYFKSNVSGNHTFYAIGGDTTVSATACSRADTFKIWVQPNVTAISGFPDTICISGSTVLSLVPNTNYYPGSIQWQNSTNGTTYTNIIGATGATYTTPILNSNMYYRSVVTAGAGVCQQPAKYVVVANPLFISKTDSSHCGPGSVTLKAVTGGNSTPTWYASATGGMPIGSGSTWQTPNISATTTYYVAAGGGAVYSNAVIGMGTTVSTGAQSPFFHSWGGYRHQFLIRAAELTAAGILPGSSFTSLTFDMVTAGFTYQNFAVSMGQTTTTALNATTWLPVTQVKAPANHTTVAGFNNTINFDVPFLWDGTSNIIVQTCWSNNNTGGTSNTLRYTTTSYVSNHYAYADNQTAANICGTSSGQTTLSQRPNMKLGYQKVCESTPRQAVIATINPLPQPNLGPDIDTCINQGSTVTLNPGTIPNNPTFLWDNNSTGNTRGITSSGVYNVQVTNQYNCVGRDTINVNMKWNPVVNLDANGVNLCIGGTKVLDAGPGGQGGGNYYWNTGATTRTITITNPGTYIAYVTSPQGCFTVDTVNIVTNGYMPTIDAIITQPLGPLTFKFSTLNPQNIVNYLWDFGDGNTGSGPTPTHTYASAGDYTVKLKVFSVCGDIIDSSSVHILGGTGINNLKDEKLLQIYPNPNNGNIVFVETKGDVKVEEIIIYNTIGQQIMHLDKFNATTKHKIQLPEHLPTGVYNIRINTNKGLTTRKLEILK